MPTYAYAYAYAYARPVLRHPEMDTPRHWCLELLTCWHIRDWEAQQSLRCKPRAVAEGLLEGSPGDAAPSAARSVNQDFCKGPGEIRRLHHEKGTDGECLIQDTSSRTMCTLLGAFLPKLFHNFARRLTSTLTGFVFRVSTQKRDTSAR